MKIARSKYKHLTDEAFNHLLKIQQTNEKIGNRIEFKGGFTFRTLAEMVEFAITLTHEGRVPESYVINKKGVKKGQYFMGSRSLRDLHKLARTYFPKATVFDVRDVLQKMVDEKKPLQVWMCSTFHRLMFRAQNGYSYDRRVKTYYGIKKK